MSHQNIEADYRRVVAGVAETRFLAGTSIEIIREPRRTKPIEHVVFDFDGTLSLVREGWPEVMVPMMVEVLQETGTRETAEELRDIAYDFVMKLNGKQTIYQMIRLAEEVTARGGKPLEPLAYKERYHDLLMQRIQGRRDALRDGMTAPEEMLVPHTFALLEGLKSRGAKMYLASGTDENYVQEEVSLLTLDRFFGSHVYGAQNDYKQYSKAMVIRGILEEHAVDGDALLGFGDGYVEIQNVKEFGGTAVAVASDEARRSGRPDAWKRERLIGVGADIVIPDYQDHEALLEYLWNPTAYVR